MEKYHQPPCWEALLEKNQSFFTIWIYKDKMKTEWIFLNNGKADRKEVAKSTKEMRAAVNGVS